MTERAVDTAFRDSLLANEPFIYYHLIKFERPKLSSVRGEINLSAEDYSYLTDAPYPVPYDGETYIPNKVLSLGSINESTEAQATTCNLKLSAAALGSWLDTDVTFAASYFEVDHDLGIEGFREGDKVIFAGGANDGVILRIDRFTAENTLRNSRAYFTVIEGSVSTGTTSCVISIASAEIRNLTSLKEGGVTTYSSYLNREVLVYRVHASPETGAVKGTPFLLFRGIISSASLNENPESESSISWGLTSHWGDFVRTNGRLTSDSAHRALGATGRPDLYSITRPEYAYDYGFQHAERAVNVMAQFTYKELRYKYKDASIINTLSFGLFGKGPKIKEEWVDVERDVDLRFNLNARYLPVVYGVQLVENNPVFVDVDNAPVDETATVYMAYALCEGEIGGIYDIYIEDQPSVCLDDVDAETREKPPAPTEDDNIEVYCVGRANKGNVLAGNNYLTATPVELPFQDITGADFNYNVLKHGAWFGRRIYSRNFGANQNLTSPSGLTHESQYTFESPITASLMFHTGKSDQEANQELVEMAANRRFKIQESYFKGATDGYWSTSHRLLDTAYVVGKFNLADGEETLPEFKFVVKGKYVDCHNYDQSFKILSGDPSAYNIGDYVNVSASGGGSYTNVQIIDKWTEYDKDGNEDVRFRWQTDWPNPGDTLVEHSDTSTITMGSITMRPSGYKTSSGNSVSAAPPTGTMSNSVYSDSGGGVLYGTFSGSLLTAVTAAGANKAYVSPENDRSRAFLVTDISGSNLYFAATDAAAEFLNQAIGDTFVVSNVVPGSGGDVGNIVKVYKTTNGITESREKVKTAQAGGYIFTDTPFADDFVPTNATGDTFDTIWEHKDLRVTTNPALQLLDYVTSKRYGQGLDIDNDINLNTWLESGRLCDDRSKVTVLKASGGGAPSIGDVFRCTASGRTIFQGIVSDVTLHGSYYTIEFDYVIGKLGYKWSDWRQFTAGDFVWRAEKVVQAASSGIMTAATFDGLGAATITLTKVSGSGSLGSFQVDTTAPSTLGAVKNTNPIVRAWSEADQTFSAPGYSLYDSDDVVYWKYLGWGEQEQRYVTRHQMNQTVNTSTPIFDNINNMLSQFNGILRYSNGKYELDIKTAAQPASTMTQGVHRLDENDIIGTIKLDDKGSKKSYNSISASIYDPQNKFASRAVTFFDSTYLKEDRGVSKQGRLNMPGITNYYNARNNVVFTLRESRYGLTINFTMDQKGYLLLPGEVIALSYSRFEWEDKYFRIESMDLMRSGLVQITAKEHNDNAYLLDYMDRDLSYTAGTIGTTPQLLPPTNLAASDNLDGAIQLTWTNTGTYTPLKYNIEIWAAEAAKDTSGDYIFDTTGDPTGNDFANATLLDTVIGSNYMHSGLGEVTAQNSNKHYWFYWIRYVKLPTAYREKLTYSIFNPLSSGPGVEGSAFDEIADNARTVVLTAPQLTFYYNDDGTLNETMLNTANTVEFTATAFGVTGLPYYQFFIYNMFNELVDTIPATGPSTDNTFDYSPPATILSDTIDSRWMPETIFVELREDSPASALQAIDMVSVQGLSNAVSAINVVVSNPTHIVVADAEGSPDMSGSGTQIIVTEGDQLVTAVADSDPWTTAARVDLDPLQYTVEIEAISPAGSIDVIGYPTQFSVVDNITTVPNFTGMQDSNAIVTYRVTVQRSSGYEVTFFVYQTFTRKGIFTPRTCSLTPSDVSVVYDSEGYNPSFQADTTGYISLLATSVGYTDPYYQLKRNGTPYTDPIAGAGWQQGDTSGEFEFHYDPVVPRDQKTYVFELETKEGAGGSASSNDVVSIIHVTEGSGGLSMTMTNSNHTVVADQVGQNYPVDTNGFIEGAGGYCEILRGSVDVTDLSEFRVENIAPDSNGVSSFSDPSGLVFTIYSGGTNAGLYTVQDDTGGWVTDAEQFTVTGHYAGNTITKIYSISKAKAGTSAGSVSMDFDAMTVRYLEDNTFTPTTITITLNAYGYNNPEYSFWTELDDLLTTPVLSDGPIYPTYGSDTGDNVITFTPPSEYSDWYGPCMVKGRVREVGDTEDEYSPNSTVTFEVKSIDVLSSTSSALVIEQTNQFHLLQETPLQIIYDNTSNEIRVYEGVQELDACIGIGSLSNQVGTTDKWCVISRNYGDGLGDTGFNPPELTYPQDTNGLQHILVGDLDEDYLGTVDVPWNMDLYSGYCDYEIAIRRINAVEGYVTRVIRQVFTRNVPGEPGEAVNVVIFTNASHIIPTGPAPNYVNAMWSNSATDIQVWYGLTQLAYDATGTIPSTWRITSISSTGFGITPDTSPTISTDNLTAQVGPHNGGIDTNPWTYPYGEVDFNIQILDADSNIVSDQVHKQRFTRAPGGLDGTGYDAITTVLSNENHSIPVDAAGNLDLTDSGTNIQVLVGEELKTFKLYTGTPLSSPTDDGKWTVYNVIDTEGADAKEANEASGNGTFTATFGDLNSMSVDRAQVTYQIYGLHDDGTRYPSSGYIERTISYNKNYNAASLRLKADPQVAIYNSAGTIATGSPTSIRIIATPSGVASPYYNWSNDAGIGIWNYNGTDDDRSWSFPSVYENGSSGWIDLYTAPIVVTVQVREGGPSGVIKATDQITIYGAKDNLDGYSCSIVGGTYIPPSDWEGNNIPLSSATNGYWILDLTTGGIYTGRITIYYQDTDITDACDLYIWNGSTWTQPTGPNPDFYYYTDSGVTLEICWNTDEEPAGLWGFQVGGGPTGFTGNYASWDVKHVTPIGSEFYNTIVVQKSKEGKPAPTPPMPGGATDNATVSLMGASVFGGSNNSSIALAGYRVDSDTSSTGKTYTRPGVSSSWLEYSTWLSNGTSDDYDVRFTNLGPAPNNNMYYDGVQDSGGVGNSGWDNLTSGRYVELRSLTSPEFRETTVLVELRNAATQIILASCYVDLEIIKTTKGF